MARTKSPPPHSWSINRWPPDVFPNDPGRGRWIVRSHKHELIQVGALSRVGRELIVMGDRYSRWLELKASNVSGYVPAPNRDSVAA